MITKYANGRSGICLGVSKGWMIDVESYARTPEKILTEVRDEIRLKRVMQRAVCREAAPQHLVDSIRNLIRR